ncbi:MAG: flagellar basal body P-ring formation chaperone FlgA [Gammaproteobacteria bacterium]|jgi:flagella basal body P-ring formation protein FlgA
MVLAGACAAAVAAEQRSLQDHASIRAAAEDYVEANSEMFPVTPLVAAGDLDSRLQLGACSVPIEAFEPPNGLKPGRAIVGVRCDDDQPWKLYVPVEIQLPGEVVVAKRPLKRGEVLSNDDLTLAPRDLSRLHRDYYTEVEPLIGQSVRRTLRRNAVVTPSSVEAHDVVRRGSDVTIIAANPTVQVRMRGKALGDGSAGERIKVQNLSSGRELSATVVGTGLVRVAY